jgi:hypothetical protein
MVTVRTFRDPAAAALTKSVLDAHDILCSLADENAQLYSCAVPIRLLVAEDRLKEAARILDASSESERAFTTLDD